MNVLSFGPWVVCVVTVADPWLCVSKEFLSPSSVPVMASGTWILRRTQVTGIVRLANCTRAFGLGQV